MTSPDVTLSHGPAAPQPTSHGRALSGRAPGASTDGVADASAHSGPFSSIWRVPVEGQTVWLKVVPHFFAHEGALLALLAGAPTPIVLGHDGGRMLLAEIAGEDLHDAKLPRLHDTVNLLVNVQRQWGDHTEYVSLSACLTGVRRLSATRSPTLSI